MTDQKIAAKCQQECDACDWNDLDCPWREEGGRNQESGGRREPIEPAKCPICGRRPREVITYDLQYKFICIVWGEYGRHEAEGNASSDRDEAAAMWNRYAAGELAPAVKNRHGAMGMG